MNFEKKQELEHSTDSVERYRRLKDTLAARGLAVITSEAYDLKLIGTEYGIIGPGSAIDGGVGIDIGSKTAIAVDIEKDQILDHFVKIMGPAYDRIAQKETREEGLIGLATIVNRILEYDQNAILSIYREDFQSDQAVVMRPLGEFITAKKGICFQRALLTGVSLEYAKRSGILSDDTEVSVEFGHDSEMGEYHAFVELSVDGELWRLDSAQRRDELASLIGTAKK